MGPLSDSFDISVSRLGRPLRFGIMCPQNGLTAFARQAIEHVLRDGLAELKLVIRDGSERAPSTLSQKLRRAVRLDGNLWYLQDKLRPTAQTWAWQLEDTSWLPEAKHITCTPERKGKWSEYFRPEDVAAIEAEGLDFLLKFGFGIIRGAVLRTARWGVWSYHHADEEIYRGGPPGFWEIYRNDPVTGILLQKLNDRLDGGVVLKKAYATTNFASYRANLDEIHRASWHMIRWVCLDIHAGRAEYLDGPPSSTTAPVLRAPNDLQMLAYWAKLAAYRVRQRIANQRVDEWNVGLVRAPMSEFLKPDFEPKVEWSAYRRQYGQMVADPFLLPGTGEAGPRVLAEEFDWITCTGRIVELRGGAERCEVSPLIDEGLHMSYPLTFEHEGEIYAIPECGVSKSIRAYRYDRNTGKAQLAHVLIEGVDAVDSTLHYDGKRWWLFHSGSEGAASYSLFIWSAPHWKGPWKPHPANPVKTDIGSSRPGGNLFEHEGVLYRPAQDGRQHYGSALAICRVDLLDEWGYRETVVRRWNPRPEWPYPDGFHTLSGANGLTVIDAKKHTWPPMLLLKRKLCKLTGRSAGAYSYSSGVTAGGPKPLG